MELYREYIKERQGLSLITHPHGFLAYKCELEELYIAEIFIQKERRGTSVLFDLIQEAKQIGVVSGCSHMTGVIRSNDEGKNRTMKAAFKVGFSIFKIDNGGIAIVKDLKGE